MDYSALYRQRFPVLRKAVERLWAGEEEAVREFCQKEARWLEDYALFMALKDRFDGVPWQSWPEGLRRRQPQALEEARGQLAAELKFWKGLQFLFFAQWDSLKALAAEKGISIIGDLPIYVAEDSADVWAHPDQFQMDEQLRPTRVAGCPPDGFSADGQLWGNPLFDWARMEQDGYRWWMERISFQFRFYDVLRIDHFRASTPITPFPPGRRPPKRGPGSRGRASPSSAAWSGWWASGPLSPRTWAF